MSYYRRMDTFSYSLDFNNWLWLGIAFGVAAVLMFVFLALALHKKRPGQKISPLIGFGAFILGVLALILTYGIANSVAQKNGAIERDAQFATWLDETYGMELLANQTLSHLLETNLAVGYIGEDTVAINIITVIDEKSDKVSGTWRVVSVGKPLKDVE